jgi:ribonuclease HI
MGICRRDAVGLAAGAEIGFKEPWKMQDADKSETIVVYTDGACSGNPGPGGWAWAIEGGRFASGATAHTTNQRMEICAALEAVRAIEGRVEVVSDSTYVVNCFRQNWHVGWRSNGWRNSQKKPVANRDLWEPLIVLALARQVSFRWVKGHGVDLMNAWVDELAVLAAQSGQGQQGNARDRRGTR